MLPIRDRQPPPQSSGRVSKSERRKDSKSPLEHINEALEINKKALDVKVLHKASGPNFKKIQAWLDETKRLNVLMEIIISFYPKKLKSLSDLFKQSQKLTRGQKGVKDALNGIDDVFKETEKWVKDMIKIEQQCAEDRNQHLYLKCPCKECSFFSENGSLPYPFQYREIDAIRALDSKQEKETDAYRVQIFKTREQWFQLAR